MFDYFSNQVDTVEIVYIEFKLNTIRIALFHVFSWSTKLQVYSYTDQQNTWMVNDFSYLKEWRPQVEETIC